MGGGKTMANTTSVDENEKLKAYALKEEELHKIEVTDKVMERIYKMESSRAKVNTRPVKRTMLLTSLMVVLASLTAFAAAEWVQIRNSAGQIILTTEEAGTDSVSDINETMDAYMAQAQASLAPGEMAAYYVKDEALNSYDPINRLRIIFKTTMHASYQNYLAEIERTSAPKLMQPDVLPEGFQYASGEVVPLAPRPLPPGEDDNNEYDLLLERLIAKADASASNEKLFIEQVQWTEGDGAKLTFSNGETDLFIWASRGLGASIPQANGSAAQKVQIQESEAIYIKAGSSEPYTNQLVWMDERSGIIYTIKDNTGSHLIKEDLINIAESMIASNT